MYFKHLRLIKSQNYLAYEQQQLPQEVMRKSKNGEQGTQKKNKKNTSKKAKPVSDI